MSPTGLDRRSASRSGLGLERGQGDGQRVVDGDSRAVGRLENSYAGRRTNQIDAIEDVEQDDAVLDVTKYRHIERLGGAQVELPYLRQLSPVGEATTQAAAEYPVEGKLPGLPFVSCAAW